MAFSPAEKAKRWRKRHPERYKESYKKHRESGKQQAKARALDLAKRKYLLEFKKDLGCGVCGETDPVVLELHHHDPATKTRNVPGRPNATNWTRLSWERLDKELGQCDVLCANCHRRLTALERGYYNNLEGE